MRRDTIFFRAILSVHSLAYWSIPMTEQETVFASADGSRLVFHDLRSKDDLLGFFTNAEQESKAADVVLGVAVGPT